MFLASLCLFLRMFVVLSFSLGGVLSQSWFANICSVLLLFMCLLFLVYLHFVCSVAYAYHCLFIHFVSRTCQLKYVCVLSVLFVQPRCYFMLRSSVYHSFRCSLVLLHSCSGLVLYCFGHPCLGGRFAWADWGGGGAQGFHGILTVKHA